MKSEINIKELLFLMKIQGKLLNNTEQMVFDELIFVFKRNRLHHCVLHTQIMGKQLFLQF